MENWDDLPAYSINLDKPTECKVSRSEKLIKFAQSKIGVKARQQNLFPNNAKFWDQIEN